MKAVLLYYKIVNPIVVVDNIENGYAQSRNSHTLASILEISVAIKFGMTENVDVKIAQKRIYNKNELIKGNF